MLAKIKDAKKIRATLAAQNELDGPDDVCHTPLLSAFDWVINLLWYSLSYRIDFNVCRQC